MGKFTLSILLCASICAFADTPYPIAGNVAAANRKAVEAFKPAAYWRNMPLAVATVDPMSGWRFLPDVMPAGGDFTNGVSVILAQGEYENGAVCLFAFGDLADVEIVPADLVGQAGRLPAGNVDVKVVKTWYQQGTAWYGGFQSDVTRRILTPELMLHDEALVHVDYAARQNYLRCDYGAETAYRWISTTGPDVDHEGIAEPKVSWIHDADVPRPFQLQKDCFKEIIFTFHAPETLAGGIYKGAFAVKSAGRKIGEIPVKAKVLPFALPKPMTFRDPNRRFLPSGYASMDVLSSPKFAANLAAHGIDTAYCVGEIRDAERARRAKETLEKYGLNTETLMCVLPGSGVATSDPVRESDKSYRQYLEVSNKLNVAMAAIREAFGSDAKAYSYGWDEAPANVVRAERPTWREVHRAGGRTVVSTPYHPYLLFNLDADNIPRQPRLQSRLNADAMHAANPDFIAAWYGDPHSGPENPDYSRRLYGWLTWRNNYDSFCQYILFRDDWTEFFVWKEPFLRGLMLAYTQEGDLIDTLAWEATREAVDDIRYGTLLRQLADKARVSDDIDVQYLGRAAATWIAQVDFERSSLDSLRMEMVEWILKLRGKLDD